MINQKDIQEAVFKAQSRQTLNKLAKNSLDPQYKKIDDILAQLDQKRGYTVKPFKRPSVASKQTETYDSEYEDQISHVSAVYSDYEDDNESAHSRVQANQEEKEKSQQNRLTPVREARNFSSSEDEGSTESN